MPNCHVCGCGFEEARDFHVHRLQHEGLAPELVAESTAALVAAAAPAAERLFHRDAFVGIFHSDEAPDEEPDAIAELVGAMEEVAAVLRGEGGLAALEADPPEDEAEGDEAEADEATTSQPDSEDAPEGALPPDGEEPQAETTGPDPEGAVQPDNLTAPEPEPEAEPPAQEPPADPPAESPPAPKKATARRKRS